ncbi:putative uncharacterized protein DDB_G0277255 [Drosophila mojavensis]|uniref:Uncharacterized protein n=1 Tax=Drosophila mojavensis TaxID=7230 RepID=B4KCS9_DROMO|nr:putative uncharacterized protein DDB_G0277255 [Drosophila mojavensis]EDW15928.1 uncharacterized protein Dmoj_GI22509 [Drosophila mojavensis]
MLLASAGQTAPFTYDSSATRKINSNNNNSGNTSSSSNNVSNVGAGKSTPNQSIGGAGTLAACPASASSIASTAATAIMKTLSVRLHRGTEFIKDTVQKALVMNGPTPVLASQLDSSFKRKLLGAGGIMGTSGTSNSNSSTSSGSSTSSSSSSNRHFVLSQPYVFPTADFMRQYTVPPGVLHRSASARKRNASTDSLLMDLCVFKPIRPMPITPIKINKARGFELKRPKFVPPAANMYSDVDDDDDEDEEEQEQCEEDLVRKEQELTFKPKLSTLSLPQHATASAFVPHEANSSSSSTSCAQQTPAHTKDNSNVHTSGTGAGSSEVKAKPTTKRRRRAPLLTGKRRRKAVGAAATASATDESAATVTAKATSAAASSKRKRRAATKSTSISPIRRSPPMTRQRARLQISTSNN